MLSVTDYLDAQKEAVKRMKASGISYEEAVREAAHDIEANLPKETSTTEDLLALISHPRMK